MVERSGRKWAKGDELRRNLRNSNPASLLLEEDEIEQDRYRG